MVFDKVVAILVENLGVEAEEVTLESHIEEDLQADSLDVVELVMSIEDAFEINVPEEEASELKTVQLLVAYIEAKLAE